MYSQYFGLEEPPFSIAPNPRYLYLSKQHREALAHLLYGIESDGGFVLLTGEVGTGKTTVCRALLEQLPDTTDVAVILNPKYSSEELLAAICDELGISYSDTDHSIKQYVDALNRHLLESHSQGRNTVLILDEAQNLGTDVLEQIRLLTNLETDCHKLLQIILVGQPELLEHLNQPELRQLSQRITARFHLGTLNRSELEAYVSHRLAVAGVQGRLFPATTLNRLYKMTRGVPRLINILCDRALLGAFVERQNRVEVNVLKKAATEVLGGDASAIAAQPAWPSVRWLVIAGAVMLMVLMMALTDVRMITQQGFSQLQQVTGQIAGQVTTDSEPGSEVSQRFVQASLGGWRWPEPAAREVNQVLAYRSLFREWGVEYDPRKHPVVCKYARTQGYACLFGSGDLDSLIGLNRPAVLQLENQAGVSFYGTLVAIEDDSVRMLIDDQEVQVSHAELKRWWMKRYTLFWQMPPGYKGVIQPGSDSQQTQWLEQQLAAIQGRDQRQVNSLRYDATMVSQVKQFQQKRGLRADGIVGPKTAIHLNTASAQSVPLLQKTAETL